MDVAAGESGALLTRLFSFSQGCGASHGESSVSTAGTHEALPDGPVPVAANSARGQAHAGQKMATQYEEEAEELFQEGASSGFVGDKYDVTKTIGAHTDGPSEVRLTDSSRDGLTAKCLPLRVLVPRRSVGFRGLSLESTLSRQN